VRSVRERSARKFSPMSLKESECMKRQSALLKPVQVSDALAEIVGRGPMPRTEVTKKLWEYIKKNKLQDSKEKRQINPDQKLGRVIGNQQIDMFQMTKKVSSHLKEISR
jgi:chromatin remodeling complex protein RSC6